MAKKQEEVPLAASTSLPHHGTEVVSTQPKFLFCDLTLEPNETKAYLYKEEIPKSSPPTYRGTSIRYFYKITIATQRVGSKVQMLQVPIRVLPICFTDKETLAVINDDDTEAVAPANPFAIKRKKESYLDLVLHYLQNLTSRRSPNYYVITNKRGRVGRFCLLKSNYKLGEDIIGTLDFTNQTVKCVQYSVTLQSEECIPNTASEGDAVASISAASSSSSLATASTSQPEAKPSTSVAPAPAPTTATPAASEAKVSIANFNNYHEVCIGMLETHLILPVPLYVTPSFKTDLVELRWRLHFQFVTSTNPNFDSTCAPGETWHAPEDIEIETMIWNLPIQLVATNPLQIWEPSGSHSLKIE